MTDDKTIKTLEKIKDKIADYEIKVIKAYRGDNNIDILFNTIYDIIDTQAEIIRGSSSEKKTGAEEPQGSRTGERRTNKSVVSSDKGRTAREQIRTKTNTKGNKKL
jgi:hypothetical protein